MQEHILTTKQFAKLVKDINTLKQTAAQQSSYQIVQTYWQIGARIAKEELSKNANYHNSIINNLSRELSIDRTTLSRCINFFETYPIIPKNKILSWSHYRHLIAIKSKTLRNQLEQQATQNCWTKNQLISAIKSATQIKNPTQKTILKRPTEATYLYKAKVLNVIDGDTIELQIDLGFDIHKNQRIRLACLDCPEINTKEGKEAKKFTLGKLAKLDFVMVQTRKSDIYGRFIAHLFYDATNTKTEAEIFESGTYLNEEILQKKMGIVI